MENAFNIQNNPKTEFCQEDNIKSHDFFQELLRIFHDNLNEPPDVLLGAIYFFFDDCPFISVAFKWDEKHQKIVKKPMLHWKTDPVEVRREKFEEVLDNFQKRKYYQGIALILDTLNWVVIDIDDVAIFSEKIQEVESFLKEVQSVSPLVTKTLQKGFHIFVPKQPFDSFTKKKIINNQHLRENLGFEIRYQDLLIIPPSRYQHDGKLYEYEILHVNPEVKTATEEELKQVEGLKKILQILEEKEIETYREKIERERRKECGDDEYYQELIQVAREVKRRLRFEDLIPERMVKRGSDYTLFRCPFHPPDNHPSFSAKDYGGEEYAKDFHDHETYDLIAFWQEYKHLNFTEALRELCKKAGIDFPERKKKAKTEKEKKEEPGEKYKSFSIEEKILSLCSKMLLEQSVSIEQKEEVKKILLFLASRDFFSTLSCQTLLKILIKVMGNNTENTWQSLELEMAKYTGLISWDWFYELLALPIPASIETLQKLVDEFVMKWKEKKIKEIKNKLSQEEKITEETLERYKLEIKEIESVQVSQDLEELEEMKLNLASKTEEDFDKEFYYLYEDFIPAGTINLWASTPSHGKSALALALSLQMLDAGIIERVYYFDGDNPIPALQKRNIQEIMKKYKGRLFYYQDITHKEMQGYLKKTIYVRKKCLIVIDTLRACIGPFDINKGEVAERFMSFLKQLCHDTSKTIIVLHHLNKPPATNPNIEPIDRIKGATEFRDRCDIAYILYKVKLEGSNLYVKLENVKARIPVRSTLYFHIDISKEIAVELDEVLSDEEEAFVKAVLDEIQIYYKNNNTYPGKKYLEDTFKEQFGRNQVRNWLKRFEGKYWKARYIRQKNSIVFVPLDADPEQDQLPF